MGSFCRGKVLFIQWLKIGYIVVLWIIYGLIGRFFLCFFFWFLVVLGIEIAEVYSTHLEG